jgi:hypothetical protein
MQKLSFAHPLLAYALNYIRCAIQTSNSPEIIFYKYKRVLIA